MKTETAGSTRYGTAALLISSICLGSWLLAVLLAGDLIWAFGLAVYSAPIAIIGDIAALYYAVKALGAPRDEKGKAWLAIVFAAPVLLVTAAVFIALSGGIKLYQ